MAATAAQRLALNQTAEKHLDTMYKAVGLLKDVGYHKFAAQLARQAFAYNWDPEILNLTTPALTPAQITAADALLTADAIKATLDRRNACLIILNKTDGHPVENLLESLAPGDPRLAFSTLHEYFHPATAAGMQSAIVTLFTSTMANTHTTITGWIALVSRNAKIVRDSGGQADQASEIAVLLKGLLPEFKAFKLILEQDQTLTLPQIVGRLVGHATTEGILELSKGGTARGGNNVFYANDSTNSRENHTHPGSTRTQLGACNMWPKFKCRFSDCGFSHDGPGGMVPTKDQITRAQHRASPEGQARQAERWKRGAGKPPPGVNPPPAAKATADCHFCLEAHDSKLCPAISNSDVNYTYLLGDSSPPVIERRAGIDSCFLTTLKMLSGMFFLLFLVLPGSLLRAITGIFAKDAHNTRLAVMLTIIAALSYQVMAVPDVLSPATIPAASFLNNELNIKNESNFLNYEWCIDPGTNRFVTNDIDDLLPSSIVYNETVVAVGSGNTTSKLHGTALVRAPNGKTIACTNVLYMPACGKKLMPASPFVRRGCKLSFYDSNKVRLSSSEDAIIFEGKEIDGLYYFESKTCTSNFNKNDSIAKSDTFKVESTNVFYGLPIGRKISETANDFHLRLLEVHHAYGHLNFDKLRKLLGLKAKTGDNPHCAACAVAMSRQAPLNKPPDRSTRINHRIHADLGYTAGSNNPFQLYIDDCSHVGYIDLLTSKDEVLENWIELRGVLENRHFPLKFACFRSDNEFVYTSNAWIQYCRDTGLEHEFSPPYRHDGLGVVERAMQTVGVSFRCMMFLGNAPATVIPYGLVHANTIRNHSPTKANGGWTPLEKEAGMKLPINERLIKGVLFCLVYIHVYDEQRAKHDPRGIPSVYLGFDARNNQFIAMEWLSGKIRYVGDATFHNGTFPFRANPSRVPDWMMNDQRISPTVAVSAPNPAPHSLPTGPRRSLRQHGYQYTGGTQISSMPDVDVPPDGSGHDQPAPPRASLVHAADELHCDLRLRLDQQELPAPATYFVHTWGKDPTNWPEAMAGPHANEWIVAMLAERESFRQHGVYILVPRAMAKGHKIFKPRPVLKIKLLPPTADAPNGTLDKFKYRLTVAAFTRMLTEGVDYKEKHSSQVRWNALKLLVAAAVQNDWDLLLIDIKTFFLYGVFDDDTLVFMEQPAGWDTPDKPASEWICQLVKTCYGHPAASNEAQKVLNTTMTVDNKFLRTAADDCVYVSAPDTPGYAAAGTHVDDIFGTGDKQGLATLTSTLKAKFDLTYELNPVLCTGVQIQRVRSKKWCKLHQGGYIIKLLEEWQMNDCTPVDTPMDPGTARAMMLLTEIGVDPVIIKKFQSLVGALLWLYKTRPDLMFTTNLLARFCRTATAAHLKLAMRVLRYLRGTIEHGIVFCAGFPEDGIITAEGDADLAGDLIGSRSTSGFYAKIGRFGTIACNSWLERKVSTSTGQAETYALASLVRELVWIRQLCYELRLPQSAPTVTGTDNQGVHLQSTKAINHATAKHYRISQAYIRSKSEDGTIKVVKVPSDLNHSDFFTKALCFKLFDLHRFHTMGPQNPPAE
jgi:hypothetical protein